MATIRPRGLNVSTGLEEVSLPTDTLEINNVVPTADATINTSVTTAQTLKLRGYNLIGGTYSDFFTVTAGNTATADLNTAVTIGSSYIYRAGGTDIPVADGGTGLSSATAYAVLCGGTTSTGAFQSVSGVGTAGQVLTSNGASALPTWQSNTPTESIIIACSDEATALTTGTAVVTFRMPYAFTLTAVRASVTTAPTGASILTVDINESGSTILSTKITIDANEKTSTTAATPPVISDASLADDAEITVDIDQVGSTIAGAGLKVYLIGHR